MFVEKCMSKYETSYSEMCNVQINAEHACMHYLSNCYLLAAKDSFAEKEIHPYMGCS